eukprot:7762437-Alexandrium_andersonii.AAC.1
MLQDTLHCDAVLPSDKLHEPARGTSGGKRQARCTWDRTHRSSRCRQWRTESEAVAVKLEATVYLLPTVVGAG